MNKVNAANSSAKDVEVLNQQYEKQKNMVSYLNEEVAKYEKELEGCAEGTLRYDIVSGNLAATKKSLTRATESLREAEENGKQKISSLINLRDDLTEAYENCSEADKATLQAAINSVQSTIEEQMALYGLTKTVEDYIYMAEQYETAQNDIKDVIDKTTEGYVWQQDEIDALLSKYPQLKDVFDKYSEAVEGGTVLQKSALESLNSVYAEIHKAYIENQLKMTEIALEEAKKRVKAYELEMQSLSLLGQKVSTDVKDKNGNTILTKDQMAGMINFGTPFYLNTKMKYGQAKQEVSQLEEDYQKYIDELNKLSKSGMDTYTRPSSLDTKNSKSSKKYAKYFGIDIDSVVAEIEAIDDEVVRAIEDTQTKIDKAVMDGDNSLELGLQEKLGDYYAEQLKINAEQVHKLENEKKYWVDLLSKENIAAFEGQDLSKLTQRQLDMAIRNYEIAIDTASVAEDDKLVNALTRQKEVVENLGSGIVNVTEKMKEFNSEALEIQNSLLEQNIALIKRKMEIEQQASDEKMKLLELEQILMEEESAAYAEVEAKKYGIILANQERIMKGINEYRAQGLADTSEEISSLKDQWYDYESDRLNIIKDFQNRKKKLEEDYESKSVSLAKSIQSTISSIYKEAIDKRKKELESELKTYQDQIDDMLQKMDREDATRTFEQQQEEQTKEILETEDEISKYKLAAADGDKTAALKVKELEEKLAEAKKKLTELQYNREKELRKDSLNDAKDKAEEETESKKEELDKQYEDAVSALQNVKDLVSLTNEEIEAMVQNFFVNIGASADGYQVKIDELISKKKELIEITRELAAVDSVLPSFNKNDSDQYNPNNSNNNYQPPNKGGNNSNNNANNNIHSNGFTEKDAKKIFQKEQQIYLHDLMDKNGDWRNGNDKDKGLTAWVLQERAKWGMDDSGKIMNGKEGYVPEEYMDEFRRRYGFKSGGQTQRTGWHWLDGESGKPEEVLSADDTKYWRKMIDLSPEFIKAMEGTTKQINPVMPMHTEINVGGSLINVEGNVDKKVIPKIQDAVQEMIIFFTKIKNDK